MCTLSGASQFNYTYSVLSAPNKCKYLPHLFFFSSRVSFLFVRHIFGIGNYFSCWLLLLLVLTVVMAVIVTQFIRLFHSIRLRECEQKSK